MDKQKNNIIDYGFKEIFRGGIKSFRVGCVKIIERTQNRLCSNHPHNYYLEILTEAGIVGLSLSMLIGLLFIIFVFKNFKILRKSNLDNLIFLAIVISIILEVFPFKSTGSIFSTGAAVQWLKDGLGIIEVIEVLLETLDQMFLSGKTVPMAFKF